MVWIHLGRLNVSISSLGFKEQVVIISVCPDASLKLEHISAQTEVYCSHSSMDSHSFEDLRTKLQAYFNLPCPCWAWTRRPEEEAIVARALDPLKSRPASPRR